MGSGALIPHELGADIFDIEGTFAIVVR